MLQSYKIFKHTQTIPRLCPTISLSVFDHFVGLARKELIMHYFNAWNW